MHGNTRSIVVLPSVKYLSFFFFLACFIHEFIFEQILSTSPTDIYSYLRGGQGIQSAGGRTKIQSAKGRTRIQGFKNSRIQRFKDSKIQSAKGRTSDSIRRGADKDSSIQRFKGFINFLFVHSWQTNHSCIRGKQTIRAFVANKPFVHSWQTNHS